MEGFAHDPIFKDQAGLWYFWDETWSKNFGPFQTKEIAEKRLDEYCKFLDDSKGL